MFSDQFSPGDFWGWVGKAGIGPSLVVAIIAVLHRGKLETLEPRRFVGMCLVMCLVKSPTLCVN